ncbi:MAG TPA: GNAT family N-acetyltransferase [Solirubrobacteraceae bacterium]
MPIEVVAADPRVEPGAGLLAAMVSEIVGLYGRIEGDARRVEAPPAGVVGPGGAFLAVFDDGAPVACGGVRRLDEEVGEIKRMYVVPAARGRGFGRRLLDALEDAARGLGYARVRLDTGSRQPAAVALYRAAGYEEIADYNGNVLASYWFEKGL